MTARPHGVVHIDWSHLGTQTAEFQRDYVEHTGTDWRRSGYQVAPVPDGDPGHVFNEPCPVCKPHAPAPDVIGLSDVAAMLGVSRQRAGQIMDPRTHAAAPESAQTSSGPIWYRPAVVAYLVEDLGREKTWED